MIQASLIGAGQRGMRAYGSYALKKPNEIKFVAVAEPDETRRRQFAEQHGIPEEKQFASWEDMLRGPRLSEALLVCTQDKEHFEPTMKGLELGYHILLEKPMSPDPRETLLMAEEAERTGAFLMICHVLRYTPFFTTLKQLVAEERIGRIITIQWNENVGVFHQAHSFVRGNWRNSGESSPMILAKCCHDMDAIQCLVDASCDRLSSFGKLTYFKADNAPAGSTDRCVDGCAVEAECPYSAIKHYYNESSDWPPISVSEPTLEARMKALREGPYGRCVYRCDNDVVDHQVVNMEFDNDVTVAFTMTAFTNEISRTLKIMGTAGEIRASTRTNEIEVLHFSGRRETIRPEMPEGAHGGGDFNLMKDFVRLVGSGKSQGLRTSATVSAQSHMLSFAAEHSRLSGNTVVMKDYVDELKKAAYTK